MLLWGVCGGGGGGRCPVDNRSHRPFCVLHGLRDTAPAQRERRLRLHDSTASDDIMITRAVALAAVPQERARELFKSSADAKLRMRCVGVDAAAPPPARTH